MYAKNEIKKKKTWTAISFLLRASTEVNAKDKYGFTVLHHAVYRDNTVVVTTLLKEKHLKLEVSFLSSKQILVMK